MELLQVIGYLLAIIIGISLGLIGGGGSILTVPVLIYFLSIDVVSSTAYSLFIVGSTSLIGAIRSYIKGNLNLKTGLIFALPALLAVWLTRALVIPAIPENIVNLGGISFTKDLSLILFFSAIMILSSVSMIRSARKKKAESMGNEHEIKIHLIIIEGFIVGVVTGLVGAGGGFLIIPALVLLAKIPMKDAVGTSLMIIALKSLIGFTGDLMNPEIVFDWPLLLIFTFLGINGIFIGGRLNEIVSGRNLKKGFGWFLLLTGIAMIIERFSNL